MKTLLPLILGFLLLLESPCFSQDSTRKSFTKKGYQAWVRVKSLEQVHGLLWNVDSAFVEIKTDQVGDWKSSDSEARIIKVPFEEIQQIRTKKVRAVLKGYGWGAIIGNSVGGLLALGYEASEPGYDAYILLMPMLGMTGSITGIIAGAAPDRTFKIYGDQKTYFSFIKDLDKRAFWTLKKK